MADRLNCSNKAKQVIDKIDKDNFMKLSTNHTSRSLLFAFAMSLGVETKTRTKLENLYSGGLILEKSIEPKLQALIYSQYISLLKDPDNELDLISNNNSVFKVAEEYANTGFEIIESYYNSKKPDVLLWELITELNEQYDLEIKKAKEKQ